MFPRVLCPYATLMKGIIFILPLRNSRDQSFREEKTKPISALDDSNGVEQCEKMPQYCPGDEHSWN